MKTSSSVCPREAGESSPANCNDTFDRRLPSRRDWRLPSAAPCPGIETRPSLTRSLAPAREQLVLNVQKIEYPSGHEITQIIE